MHIFDMFYMDMFIVELAHHPNTLKEYIYIYTRILTISMLRWMFACANVYHNKIADGSKVNYANRISLILCGVCLSVLVSMSLRGTLTLIHIFIFTYNVHNIIQLHFVLAFIYTIKSTLSLYGFFLIHNFRWNWV